MGQKKIKKRGKHGLTRVARAIRGIMQDIPELPPGVAPIPIWKFTGPMPGPDEPNAAVPAILPELVDPVIVITDPYLVADFEKTGLRIARYFDEDFVKVLLWLIDTSRDLDKRRVDDEYAIDFGPDIKNRIMGGTFAELARNGLLRIAASGDEQKVIAQFVFRPEDYENRAEIVARYRQHFPMKPLC